MADAFAHSMNMSKRCVDALVNARCPFHNADRNGLTRSNTARAPRHIVNFTPSSVGFFPGAACGNPKLRSIELKKCRSFIRFTSSVFQVIASEIE